MRTYSLVVALAAPLALLACTDETTVPPVAPPEPAAAVSEAPVVIPAALTDPLDATPGTAVQAFSVPSIHCEGCAETIRAKVEKLPGVQAVSVSVPKLTVWVRVDESTGPAADAVAQTITDAGYDATIATPEG